MIVAAITQGSPNDGTGILRRLAIQREHYLRMGSMRVAHAVLVLDAQYTAVEGLLDQASFISPCTVQVAYPHVPHADGEEGRIELPEHDGLLGVVEDLCPGLDHVDVLEGLVEDLDTEIIYLVLEGHGHDISILG